MQNDKNDLNLESKSAFLTKMPSLFVQLSTTPHQPEFERLNHWNEIRIEEQAVAEAGQRIFYVGSTRGRRVTVMVTPEPKVDTHHLLAPLPLASFKDDLPRHLLPQGCLTRGKTIPGELLFSHSTSCSCFIFDRVPIYLLIVKS